MALKYTLLSLATLVSLFDFSGYSGEWKKHVDLSNPENGISIVTACGNKETFEICLNSWLGVPEVQRIIIVNWGANEESIDAVRRQRKHHKNRSIILINVYTKEPFWLTVAYNIGFDFVEDHEVLFKVDCDTLVDRYFFTINTIFHVDSDFYSGNWKSAVNENQKHLNGILIARKRVISSIGGFDERIKGYGWDDSDIFNRLENFGWKHAYLDMKPLRHLEHSDASRCMYGSCNSTFFEIVYNKCLLEGFPEWNASSIRSKYFSVFNHDQDHDIVLDETVSSIHDQSADYKNICARKAAANILGKKYESLKLNASSTHYLVELANFDYMLYQVRKERVLILHAMHGLGNRLRALGSALAAAEVHQFALVLIWPIDEHIQAPFEDLFIKPQLVHEIWRAPRIDYENFAFGEVVHSVDYMNEQRSSFIPGNSMITYIRSAYVLNLYGVSDEMINQHLRALSPSFKVQEILDCIRQPKGDMPMLGIHIRKAGIMQETPNLSKTEYSATGTAYIEGFRKMTGDALHLYEEKVIQIMQDSPNMWVYLSNDSPVESSFLSGVPHISLSVTCQSRATQCIQFAVADLLMLGRSTILLGSFWSSFTEVASRIAGVQPIYPKNYHQTSPLYLELTGNASAQGKIDS
eukprot:jgi/Picre1/33343/NNA_008667.t1